jgi:PRTRC genetic system protein E
LKKPTNPTPTQGENNVFTELMPLLAHRTVLITVARENDTTLRVNILPKRANDSENAALTTPLSFTGTPEELDRDFARELASFVDAHQALGSTLSAAKATMEAAAKAAQEEAKRKADERRKSKTTSSAPSPTPSDPPPPAPGEAKAVRPNAGGSSGNTASAQPVQGGLRL